MYIQVHARRDAAAGWRPRSPPFVGRFHTMDLDSFRKGIKEEFFQSSSSFQAHIQHKALDTGTLVDHQLCAPCVSLCTTSLLGHTDVLHARAGAF